MNKPAEITEEFDSDQVEIIPPSRDVSPIVAAEIMQQIATAHRFPRRRDADITAEIMGRAGLDEETAAECMYTLPRAGKDITGPSIRFAEIVMMSFGNLRAAARFIEIDMKVRDRAAVVVEGVCLDLQANVSRVIAVRRSIMTSAKGGKAARMFNADMTNIAVAAGSAIATREAILKCVPKAIWGPAYKRVISILQGDATTLAKRREQVIAAFAKRGIEAPKVFEFLDLKSIDDVTIEHMPRLFGMLTALADGTETTDSMFGKPEAERAAGVESPLHDGPAGSAEPTQSPTTAKSAANTAAAGAQKAAQPAAANSPGLEKHIQAAGAEAEDSEPSMFGGAQPIRAEVTDGKSYAAWAGWWIANNANPMTGEALNEAGLRKQWTDEKTLRRECKVSGDQIEGLTERLNVRITDLKG